MHIDVPTPQATRVEGRDELRVMDLQLLGQLQNVPLIGCSHISRHVPPSRVGLTRKHERHYKRSADEH
jgi:hypothetical protein